MIRTNRRQILTGLLGAALYAGGCAVRAREQMLAGIRFEHLRSRRDRGANRVYLVIHGDETTARDVLRAHLRASRALRGQGWLVAHPTRTVALPDGRLDPNRMFSRDGAQRNLRRLNPQWSAERLEAELDRLDRERDALLRFLQPPPGGLLVALHNNGRGYDVHTELPISNAHSLPDKNNPGDFFLVTDEADFRLLSALPYNAVLQSRPAGEDDGSLSRWMAARGLRYVNLETRIGRAERQREMLEALERVLP